MNARMRPAQNVLLTTIEEVVRESEPSDVYHIFDWLDTYALSHSGYKLVSEHEKSLRRKKLLRIVAYVSIVIMLVSMFTYAGKNFIAFAQTRTFEVTALVLFYISGTVLFVALIAEKWDEIHYNWHTLLFATRRNEKSFALGLIFRLTVYYYVFVGALIILVKVIPFSTLLVLLLAQPLLLIVLGGIVLKEFWGKKVIAKHVELTREA